MTPSMTMLLRIENAAFMVMAVLGYYLLGGSWLWFFVLLLLPDVSMLGYLGGPRIGAICYNIVHNWATALALLFLGWLIDIRILSLGALILSAHIAMDRIFGYGLKYSDAFQNTHLGRIGKRDKQA